MLSIETLILITGILLLLGIASNQFSSRMGVPVLFIFLVVGMLAGSEGIGGIEFEDYSVAYGIGTVALCLILFDGGVRTPYQSIRSAWKPASVLATLGVFITAVTTGLAASWILGLTVWQGLLLGSIVGSTDASVVFSVLRGGGVQIRPRLANTLEVESGSNDPMAIFLTIGLIQVLTGEVPFGVGLLTLFLNQIVVGTLVGLWVGWAGSWMLQHIRLKAAGLYPVMATGLGMFAFGFAAAFGGSGFLAVYLAGIVIGNRRPVFHRGILLFHDALAWMCQILMFTALGILSFPSRLIAVAMPALMIALVLIFIARPLAVFICAAPFRFSRQELTFLSWVGLKGAVPITLATFPMLAGLPGAAVMFDTVFFVVLVSALVQGWTLPSVAKYLKLDIVSRRPPPVTLEISSLRNVEGDIVEYYVDKGCRAEGSLIRNLALPEGVVIALIVRDEQTILPQGRTRIQHGDHIIVVLRPKIRAMVDRVFACDDCSPASLPVQMEFPLRGSIMIRDLEQCYGLTLGGNPNASLSNWMREQLSTDELKEGATVRNEQLAFHIRELTEDGSIENVGMTLLPQEETTPEATNPTELKVAETIPASPVSEPTDVAESGEIPHSGDNA
ncbi:potassium/proton antiporter [Rhodopirellula sallentina]|uniref:Sodium/hydrogen exchanger family protein n=1 Tax=Rhodopirellula sallentina SM41 TaxID=1263870 RepID=M5TZ64_9BACT|nr:potassium/proton antiporter [Rhodopirellula sallentina]EMI54309.1 sodium/hydrogen exchanger family protein [Rhodopirellula sallentina SM41]